jgi:hypothetical protein
MNVMKGVRCPRRQSIAAMPTGGGGDVLRDVAAMIDGKNHGCGASLACNGRIGEPTTGRVGIGHC